MGFSVDRPVSLLAQGRAAWPIDARWKGLTVRLRGSRVGATVPASVRIVRCSRGYLTYLLEQGYHLDCDCDCDYGESPTGLCAPGSQGIGRLVQTPPSRGVSGASSRGDEARPFPLTARAPGAHAELTLSM